MSRKGRRLHDDIRNYYYYYLTELDPDQKTTRGVIMARICCPCYDHTPARLLNVVQRERERCMA